MDLLYINNYSYLRGGSERIFLGEMQILKQHEHSVAAFARQSPHDDDSADYKFYPPNLETATLGFSWAALKTVKEIIYSNTVKKALASMIEYVRPDIAHAHNIYGRLTTSVLDVLQEKGVPVVMTLHDLKLLCPSYLMLNHGMVCERCKGKRFYNAILTKCHKNSYAASTIYAFETWLNHFRRKYDVVRFFIAPSRFLLNKHLEYGYSDDRFVYLPNFIDNSYIKPSYKKGKYWLYFGRLSGEKGINTLLKAFLKFESKIPLIVAGDGPERRQLESHGIPNVRFTGFLHGNALLKAISGALCVVMPSECYENSPLSVLEAMACGKPVIGSRIGGIPELIRENETGYLFEPGDIDDLLSKMMCVFDLTDRDIQEMGRSAKRRVERDFSAAAHYRMLMEIYDRAMVGLK